MATPAYSQRSPDYKAISGFDAYGNARSIAPSRRPIGIFQNDTQREMLRGYQMNNRREEQRGGASPFALSTDQVLGISLAPMYSRGFGKPGVRKNTTKISQQTFNRYGGFSNKEVDQQIGDLTLAFSRKNELIRATSLDAPVRRAFWENGVAMGIRTAIEKTPFQQSDTVDQPDESQIPTLDEKLVKQVALSHARSQQQAWGWFMERNFRRAVRSFEIAISLESDDMESRIGLIYSHFSLGASQTTFAVLREIHRREVNPFALDLIITDRFNKPNDAQRLVFQMRTLSERYPKNLDVQALYAFMLWFTGDREEAIRVMDHDDQQESRSPYADWLKQMQAIHTNRVSP